MNYFIRNVLFFHLLALVLAFSWIHGGTRPDLLLPVIPWMSFLVLELMLVFPQAKSDETLSEARARVFAALVRDPLFYFALLLVIYLCLPFSNVSGQPEYNAVLKIWRNPPPPNKLLPFCVDTKEHAVILLWFPPALIAALAAKHGLLKKNKRLLFESICWNGAVLAAFGFWQLLTGAQSIFWGEQKFSHFFATFGYPNFAGAYFTLLFALSAGLWISKAGLGMIGPVRVQGTFDEPSMWQRHYMLVATLLNFAGAIASLSRAAILLSGIVMLTLGMYTILGLWQTFNFTGRIKMSVSVIIVLGLAGIFLGILAPKSLKAEIATINPDAVVMRVSGRGYYHNEMAKEIYRDHRWFGVGGWGYPHYLLSYLTPEQKKRMQITGGANVHNDTLQFLAEHGAIGFTLIVSCALALLVSLVLQMYKMCRRLPFDGMNVKIIRPVCLYKLPPVVVAVFVGAGATVCHSLGDLPFRCPAVLIVWVLAFVCVTGYIPVVRRK
ncbi:MAG: O-antigen ligase family protein [Kiritimatiellae bacterium]|nr:O-antigen ligase family protein [Kiritimatiellia bacterium]